MTRLDLLELAAASMFAEADYYEAANGKPDTRAKTKAKADRLCRALDREVRKLLAGEESEDVRTSGGLVRIPDDAVDSEAP